MLLLIVILAPLLAHSQDDKPVDVIYLKTDSVLRGEIIDSIPGLSKSFKTVDNEYLFIPLEDIRAIKSERDANASKSANIRSESASSHRGTSYWLMIKGGIGKSFGDKTPVNGQLDMTNGIFINNKIGVGIGVGVRFLGDQYNRVLPVYLHLQSSLSENNVVSPLAAISFGAIADLNPSIEITAPFLRADIGIQVALGSGSFFTSTLGFEQLDLYFKGESEPWIYRGRDTIHNLTLNLGLMF